jgi:hypothetical protein
MIEIAFYAIALTAAAWAVWVRRATRPIPFERTTTSAIIQLAVAIVLIAPATEPVIGRLFWEVTGRWHLDDLLGHCLELGAMVSSTLAGMMRMPSMRRNIVPLLWHPLVIGTAVLMALFFQTGASRNPAHNMFRVAPPDPWLNAYFCVLWALLTYYGGLVAWLALSHLRDDPRAKPVALTWLACVGLGAAAMVGWLLPWTGITGWYDYGRLAACACVAVFSVSSARSWQRKLAQWQGLIQVTGAKL